MPSSPSARRAPPPLASPAAAAAAATAATAVALAPAPALAVPLALALAPSVAVAVALSLIPACGNDTDPNCDRSFLRYDNFGSPFIVNWCRACHSSELPPGMRQDAPIDVNFDTLDEIRAWSSRINLTAGAGTSMPPTGGPSASERVMLVEWLRCGAR